jgi:hypothetical protein
MSTSPDIEIYLAHTPAQAVLDWLNERFPGSDAQKPRPAGKKQWKHRLVHGEAVLPVLVIEDAAPGFTSVWFDSPETPWADDIACAREAFARFGTEVRATPGSWREGDDPDLWWKLDAGGEGTLHWPG